MNALIEALGKLEVTQGRQAGQPFTVLPWQKRFIRGAFAPDIDTAALSIARVVTEKVHFAGGCGARGHRWCLGSTSRSDVDMLRQASFSQGRVIFDHVVAFMGERLADRRKYRVWDTVQQMSRIADRETGASLKVIGSDPRRAHGLAPVLILVR